MTKGRRILKNLSYVLLFVLLSVIVIYFLWSYFRLNDEKLPESQVCSGQYVTEDYAVSLEFDVRGAELQTGESRILFGAYVYESNIIELKGASTYYFIVVSGGRLYSRELNQYLYRVTQ